MFVIRDFHASSIAYVYLKLILGAFQDGGVVDFAEVHTISSTFEHIAAVLLLLGSTCINMSIDGYFLTRSSSMPAKLAKNNNKSCEAEHRPANTASMVSTEITTSAKLPTASETTTLGPALRQVIEEITGNITSFITQKVDSLAEELKSQAAEVKKLAQRTTDAEDRTAAQEDGLDQATGRIEALEKQVLSMTQRIENGVGAVKFFERWLPEFLRIETKSGCIKLERAHRSLAPLSGPSQRQRPVLIRFHNFTDQQWILKAARRMGTGDQPLVYEGSKIMFFQDFSAESRKDLMR